jgi:hypothetical protein
MRPLHAIVVVALSVSVAACGGSSSPSDAAAKQFVAAVTHDDRATGCDQVGESLLEAHGTGGLPRALLAQCTSSDLFAITGACDRAAVIFGTSVTGDSDRGDSAKATLSSGATLGLQRSGGKWHVSSVSGGSPQHIKQGLCAGAGATLARVERLDLSAILLVDRLAPQLHRRR